MDRAQADSVVHKTGALAMLYYPQIQIDDPEFRLYRHGGCSACTRTSAAPTTPPLTPSASVVAGQRAHQTQTWNGPIARFREKVDLAEVLR